MKAAARIQESMQGDTAWAIETVIRGLEVEIASPSSSENRPQTVASYRWLVLNSHIENLVILGRSFSDVLIERADRSSGNTASCLRISLARLGDPRVHSEIRNLIASDPNPDIRALAAGAIWHYADTSDIPLLLAALKDPYSFVAYTDYDFHDGDYTETIFPVVWGAYHSLIILGVLPDSTNPKGYKYIDK
jgi:hypothetical protein